jgi:cytosine/uracil/thiamine/allantoin permease
MKTLKKLLPHLEAKRANTYEEKSNGNEDTFPLPPERRTFGPWEFVTLCVVTGSFNIGGYFLISCAVVIPTIFVTLIWFTAAAHSGGSLLRDVSAVAEQVKGSHLVWTMILGICTDVSSISVHIYVPSDYTRYARRPRDQILEQLVMVPSGTIIAALIGIICTSCTAQIFLNNRVSYFGNHTSSLALFKHITTT